MGKVILFVYGWGFGIAALVENFMYLRDEGFMAWLLFGEIVATFVDGEPGSVVLDPDTWVLMDADFVRRN